ncbi:hypothetical protein OROHE_000937 [Orobanche hederae]
MERRGGGRRLFRNLAAAEENAKTGGARRVPDKLVVVDREEIRSRRRRGSSLGYGGCRRRGEWRTAVEGLRRWWTWRASSMTGGRTGEERT